MPGTVQKPLVSIVMPVYNAEKYLEGSLRSITAQQYRNLEIICVNDGSTDDSVLILKRWRRKDQRIRIFTQKNQGAGEARNRGMDLARGKYLLFLDADDVFRKSMIRILVQAAEEKDTDIIFFQYYKFEGHKKVKADPSAKNLKVPMGRVITPESISDRLYQADHGMPWNKFYKRAFVRKTKVRFQNLKNTNDEYFSRITAASAGRILFLDKVLVGYRTGNPGSLQGNIDKGILECTKAVTAIHDELIARGLYERYYRTYQKLVAIILLWRLEEKDDFEQFCILAGEIASDTLAHCEVDPRFVGEPYREVFRALQEKDIPKAAFALGRVRKQDEPTIIQRIRRKLESVIKWGLRSVSSSHH